MFLNVPRIELFAREQSNRVDWDYWGDELDKFDPKGNEDTFTQQMESTRRQQVQLAEEILKNKSQSHVLQKDGENDDEMDTVFT
jgi:hypothetical protein